MTQIVESVRPLDRRIPTTRSVTFLLCAAILLVAIAWQSRWGVIPDTSWIITMVERVLAGGKLYVDIVETNPPFTLWLYLPPVAFASSIGVSADIVVHIYVYALCIVGLGGAALLARCAGFAENPALFALLPAFLALLTIFPGNSFSEREHIGVALLLPLLVMSAWRATPEAPYAPSLLSAILAGVSASVIVLVKPYYALLVIVAALYVAGRLRSLRPLFSPEYLVAAAISVAYLVAVLVFHPEFMDQVYPLLADTYLRATLPWTVFSSYLAILLLWLFLMFRIGAGASPRPLVIVLSLASLAAYVPLLYQGKGWPYHAYPAISLGIAALLCQAFAGKVRPHITQVAILLVMIAIAAMPYLQTQKPDREFVAAIRSEVPKPVVALIGSDIADGHPLTRMVDGTWSSIYCSDWLGVFATYFQMSAQAKSDTEEATRYGDMADRIVGEKVSELIVAQPDLLLVRRGDTIWLERLAADPHYAPFMQDYRLLAEDRGLEAWVRKTVPARN